MRDTSSTRKAAIHFLLISILLFGSLFLLSLFAHPRLDGGITGHATGGQGKGSAKETPPDETENRTTVIVVLKGTEDIPSNDLKARKDIIRREQEKFKMHIDPSTTNITITYETIPTLAVTVTSKGLEDLEKNPRVANIVSPQRFSLALDSSRPRINATLVHTLSIQGVSINGSGQTVCVIDTGIDSTHPAFQGKILAEMCYCDIDGTRGDGVGCCPNGLENQTGNARDSNGHGTHIAGIVAARDGSLLGVAPEANIVAVRFMDSQGIGDSPDALAGIDFCIANKETYNISVITASFGSGVLFSNQASCDNSDLAFAASVNAAHDMNIFFDDASGNGGDASGIAYPSCLSNVTSVARTTADTEEVIHSSSNRGPLLDLLAPGTSIVSAALGGGTVTMSGTSMAAPHVAGAALLLQHYAKRKGNFTLSPQDIETLLNRYSPVINGYPRIDVWAALRMISIVNRDAHRVENDFGSITFISDVDMTNIQHCTKIQHNFIEINTTDSKCHHLNASADLYFSNLSFRTTPVVLINNVFCAPPLCNVISYDAGNLTVRVVHFTSFTTGINANLTISDQNDEGLDKRTSENISFFANYTNRTSGAPISDGNCSIFFANESFSMNFNETWYVFSRNFSATASYDWNVSCTASAFETLEANDSIYINNSLPTVAILQPSSGSDKGSDGKRSRGNTNTPKKETTTASSSSTTSLQSADKEASSSITSTTPLEAGPDIVQHEQETIVATEGTIQEVIPQSNIFLFALGWGILVLFIASFLGFSFYYGVINPLTAIRHQQTIRECINQWTQEGYSEEQIMQHLLKFFKSKEVQRAFAARKK
ncbi:S8 family serine peptidase [Candidatus Woesearchaeota archaeon]|nr:S8 family serine peptidase [Candidatus Woesearchaeota archaeon]